MDEPHQTLLKSWAAITSHMIGEFFDNSKHLIEIPTSPLPPFVCFVSAQLFLNCHLTSESALILLQHGKEWDADILCRTVLEGSIKHAYLLHGEDQFAHESRCKEFWYTHPNIMLKNDCTKAKDLYEHLINMHGQQQEGLDSLRDMIFLGENLAELWATFSKQDIREISKKWSIANMLHELSSTTPDGADMLKLFSYRYGISCHLSHMDGIGVGNIWDRYRREEERYVAVTVAHAAGLLFNIIEFSKIRASYLKRACGESTEPLFVIENSYSDLISQLVNARKRFNTVEYNNTFESIADEIIKKNMEST